MTDRTPVIGLTTYSERARWGPWDRRAAVLMNEYSDAVVRAGGVPVLLPPLAAGADAVVARLDGLVLTGGADVDPTRYGAEPLAASDTPRVDRDEWELEVLRAALAAPLPVLAICRGLQVLNVALGGTLHQ
ncbi:MAG: gamma-glutamyl-gamma-aminobutyrate hydrolase family protein, partial [Acidimicrobiales bacterium]